jgi:hypothetical protein
VLKFLDHFLLLLLLQTSVYAFRLLGGVEDDDEPVRIAHLETRCMEKIEVHNARLFLFGPVLGLWERGREIVAADISQIC